MLGLLRRWRLLLLLPVISALGEERLRSTTGMRVGLDLRASTRDGLNGGAHWRCNSDGVRIIASAAFDSIARWQEGVEALDQIGMASKELRDAVNNPGSIDGLALEIFHNIKKAVIHIGLVVKLYFNLVQIGQGIVQNWLLAMGNAALRLLLRLALASSSASGTTATAPTTATVEPLLHRLLAVALLQRASEHRGATASSAERIARWNGRMRDRREHLVLDTRVIRSTVLRRSAIIRLKGATKVCARP